MRKFILTLIFLAFATILWAQSAEEIFTLGTDRYRAGRYGDAILYFRQLRNEYPEYIADATFWVAKSQIAFDLIEPAEQNIRIYIDNYPENRNYAEAHYLQGRIEYLKSNYEESILLFTNFVDTYPNSPFVPNAFYWIGEASYAIGELELATQSFETLISAYPTSLRRESAEFRLELIEYGKREIQLLNILQGLQQTVSELSANIDGQEEEYEDALSFYQERLENITSNNVKVEIEKLNNQVVQLLKDRENLKILVSSLEEQIQDKDNQIQDLQSQEANTPSNFLSASRRNTTTVIRSTDPDIQAKLDLISLKEESLALKEGIIEQIENAVESIGRSR